MSAETFSKYDLIVLDGPDLGSTYQLRQGRTIIGRLVTSSGSQEKMSAAHFRLTDRTVSRRHCLIAWTGDAPPEIINLSETNHTYVNGNSVLRSLLLDGDIISMGQTKVGIMLNSQ